jgi:hypothetical protein
MSVHHDRLIGDLLRQLEPGCPIYTSDGQQIGTLAEMHNDYLRVNAPMRKDFWVKADFAVACEPGRVDLTFTKDDLNAYKLDNIDREDPLKEQGSDLLVSEEEQMEQRMRMERDLAEQRKRLVEEQGANDVASPSEALGSVGEPVEKELERLEQRYGPVDDVPTDPVRAGAGATSPPAGPDRNGAAAQFGAPGSTQDVSRDLGYSAPVRPPEPFPTYVPPQGSRRRVQPWMLGLAGIGVLLGAGFIFRRSRRKRRLIKRITDR